MDKELIFERLTGLVEQNRRTELHGAILMLNVVDIAEFLDTLPPEKMLMLFRMLPKDMSADVFTYLDVDRQQKLLETIGDREITRLVEDMFIDDAVDFLEEMPAGVVKRVLKIITPETRELINKFFSYEDYSAGSIMTIEYAELMESDTVKDALEILRKTGIDKETINTCYVIGPTRHLVGFVELRRLIMARPEATVGSIMDKNVMYVHTTDDQETVANTVRRYDLISIPVVDKENRLVGIVTIDDVVDVLIAENTEDIEKMSALLPSENEYMKTSIWELYKNRIPWLLILMVSATFTGYIITCFDDVLSETGKIGFLLTACVPMLMGTGGNCGNQSSTLVIRGIALGKIAFTDILKVLWKEIRVAVITGITLGAANVLRQVALYYFTSGVTEESVTVTFIVSLAIVCTVIISKSIGCTLPLFADKLNLDPALMAYPVISTLVDACSLLVLLSIATLVVG